MGFLWYPIFRQTHMGKKYGATGHGGLTCFHQPKSGPDPSWESKIGKNMIAPWDSPITENRNPHQKGDDHPLVGKYHRQPPMPHLADVACPRTRRRFNWLLKASTAFWALWFLMCWLSSQHLPHETSSGTKTSERGATVYQPVSSKFGNLGTCPPMKLTNNNHLTKNRHLLSYMILRGWTSINRYFGVHQPTAIWKNAQTFPPWPWPSWLKCPRNWHPQCANPPCSDIAACNSQEDLPGGTKVGSHLTAPKLHMLHQPNEKP